MVAFQEQAQYDRVSNVNLNHYDEEAYAKVFRCRRYTIGSADPLAGVPRETLTLEVPALIEVPIDYSDNVKLVQDGYPELIH